MFMLLRSAKNSVSLVAVLVQVVVLSSVCAAGPPSSKSKPSPAASNISSPKLEGIDVELKAAIASAPKASDWPNSNYARLLDLANITVQSDGTVFAKYRLTYKLFNDRDRDRLAEVSIPYNSAYQTIHVISARTVHKDGTIIKVKNDDMRASSPYSEFLMYDDAQAMSFSMPAVEDDCIIDYTWEEVTRPMVMPGQFTQFWSFSGFEPVGISRIVLHIPADKKIKYKVYNDDTLKPVSVTSLDGKSQTYTWERTNIKPVDNEPLMPRSEEVSSWLEISSLSSWQDIAHRFWDLQHPQTKASKEIKATVDQLVAGKSTDAEKAKAIYTWVATRTRYVGLEFGISAYKPHAASEVHNKLYGDCKDKATLLISMLGLAGIKADPVFLHADERREIDAGLPTLNAFNHCIAIAAIDGKDVWLDATAETCPYGDIPMSDRGVRAFVVKDGKGEFKTIPMYAAQDNGTIVSSQVHVQESGSADIDMSITLRGELAQQIRSAIKARTPDQCKEMIQKMAQEFSTGATLQSYSIPEAAQTDFAFVLTLKLAAPNYAKKIGKLLIMPLEVGAGGRRQTNPFVRENRTWPIVEEVPSSNRNETTLFMPAGFSVEAVPEEVKSDSQIQEYSRIIHPNSEGNTVVVISTVIAKAGKVAADQYAKTRSYYDTVIKTSDDLIVIKRGN